MKPPRDQDEFEPQSAEKDSKQSPIDTHVGSRMRLRRTLLGMSQERLGDALGLTFQQVQKYERGVNRVSASRLFDLSRVLDVPISFFYDALPEKLSQMYGGQVLRSTSGPAGMAGGFAEAQDRFGADDKLQERETRELVRAYFRIPDPVVRKRFLELLRSMAPDTDG